MIALISLSSAGQPFYATKNSAGFDICSSESVTIAPGEYKAVSTGLFIDKANSYGTLHTTPELQIRPRSGLAAKYGVTVLNTPGTVDMDYPGEIKVILINHGKEAFHIAPGDRIAQGVVADTLHAIGIERHGVDRVGGFGSTGV